MKRTEPKAKNYSEVLSRRADLTLEEINLQTFFMVIFAGGALFLLPASMGSLFFGELDLFLKILQISLVISIVGTAFLIIMMIIRLRNWISIKKQTKKFLKAEKKAKKQKKVQKSEERGDEL